MPTYSFIFFYRLRHLSDEEEERARREWEGILQKWPSKIRLMGLFDHAWGTPWNGYMILECESVDDYLRFWKWLRDRIRWYVPETQTIVGVRRS